MEQVGGIESQPHHNERMGRIAEFLGLFACEVANLVENGCCSVTFHAFMALLFATFLGSLLLALCVFAFLVGALLGGSVLGLLCAVLSRHVGLSCGEVKWFW